VKRLSPPVFSAALTVESCAVGISNPERAQALRDALPVIQASEVEYRELGPSARLFEIAESNTVTPQLSADLMGTIYKSNFARKGAPSRALYEEIRMAPEFGICPLCAQRIVSTVDHYLPQSRHPKLNLTPVNLIPACSDCNKRKLAGVATRAEEQTLHPYYDDLGNERWLVVEIQASSPPTITFAIRPPRAWSAVLAARAQHHFRVMGISELYVAQAASEMADISYALENVGASAGSNGVRQHLDEQFQSRCARDANSWRTALYEGLRDSDWFCNEGYRMIRSPRA